MRVKALQTFLESLPSDMIVFIGDNMSATSAMEAKVIDGDLHIIGK